MAEEIPIRLNHRNRGRDAVFLFAMRGTRMYELRARYLDAITGKFFS